MELIELSLALIFVVALLGALAKRVPIPLPLLFILAGMTLSAVPQLRNLTFDPEVFFLLFIPPLLFADGWLFNKREFLTYRYSILLLALGLVVATVVAVGYTVHALIPGVPLAAGFALGAVVSPTDAVAVSALTEKLKLPLRMTTIVNGESLINDASGLVAFKFAVTAAVTGAFSMSEAALSFLLVAGGGALIGLAASWLIEQLRLQLTRHRMEAAEIQVWLSLLTPFGAYLAAESAHVSGVLAAVTAGIHSGLHDTRFMSIETRMLAWSVWRVVLFVLNGLVFLLLGLQLHSVFHGIAGYTSSQLAGSALAVWAIVVGVRLLWIVPGSRIGLWLNRVHQPNLAAAPWRDVFIAGWAGLRGAVTLAAALSIPLTAGTASFPGRDLLIFLASSVIVLTLVVNGLTLPMLIRWLGVTGDDINEREARAARVAVAHAAIGELRSRLDHQASADERNFTMRLIAEYHRRIQEVKAEESEEAQDVVPRVAAERSIRLAAVAAERAELHALRDKRRINEQVLFVIQHELDYVEAALLAPTQDARAHG
jgi:Na+/H+ antiporter